MQRQELVQSVYYLNPPGEWNTIKQWIQAVHFQEKISHNESTHLWIIDNLHKIADGIEDFPDASVWGADYCICCTRDLNDIPTEKNMYYEMSLTSKQIVRRAINEEVFLECYNVLAVNRIGRKESDYLYQCIGGNLAMLRYIITNGNLPRSPEDWQEEQFIDYQSIYSSYFGSGRTNKITRENLDDTLQMLFLSQIDFAIPFYLQCNVCRTVLRDFYYESADKQLEMEHASLAELLTVCICREFKMDYGRAFTSCLHWVLPNLADGRLAKQEQAGQINRFLQLLYGYKFILNSNEVLCEILSYDKCLTDFLEENKCFISCSTWKRITEIVEENSKTKEIFCKFVLSPQFIDTMCLALDFDFQFFRDRLSEAELEEVEKQVLSHAAALVEHIIRNGNEVCLMHLLLSLSEGAAVEFVEQMSSHDLVAVLSNSNDGLLSFARYYYLSGDEVKNSLGVKMSSEDYRDIFMNSASISGFVSLLAAGTEAMKRELCSLLSGDFIDRLIQNTIEKNYFFGALSMSIRELKRNFKKELTTFEAAIGIKGYERLLEAQGTIPGLVRLMENSSVEMQGELSKLLESKTELVKCLMERTIKEGSSIRTLDLSIRELKRESEEALIAFEVAMGVKGYERLLESQGTIPVLVHLMQYSSMEMQKELLQILQCKPELVKNLVERTIKKKSSIGTLNLSIGELKKESAETLRAFEVAIGVEGYEKLLESQGTISIFVSLMRCSSAEMQKELFQMLESKPELVKSLVERTLEKGAPIGKLNLSIRALSRHNDSGLRLLENLIGADGYLAMFSKCNAYSITILRIMACSSLSDFLVDILYANTEVWNESKNYILETSCTIMGGFNDDLFYAQKKGRKKFFTFFRDFVSLEECLGWMRQGATLEEAVLIMRNLPFGMAKQISNIWLKNYDEVIEDIRLVGQQRTDKKTVNPQTVKWAIRSINNYNRQLSGLLDKEYEQSGFQADLLREAVDMQ